MGAVLGIDAAWTKCQPSGAALVVDHGAGWRPLKIAASYRRGICSQSLIPKPFLPRQVSTGHASLRSRGSVSFGAAALRPSTV